MRTSPKSAPQSLPLPRARRSARGQRAIQNAQLSPILPTARARNRLPPSALARAATVRRERAFGARIPNPGRMPARTRATAMTTLCPRSRRRRSCSATLHKESARGRGKYFEHTHTQLLRQGALFICPSIEATSASSQASVSAARYLFSSIHKNTTTHISHTYPSHNQSHPSHKFILYQNKYFNISFAATDKGANAVWLFASSPSYPVRS
mmetsp:Transcript_4983/g.14291  ORF Transcript_4983/g.14291 Transcript_4983/m.14291 type:complete len:210 (+) Transcript_4983:399-1028(+)